MEYCFIPPHIWQDKNLKLQEKALLGRIIALSQKTGSAHANNNYYAQEFQITPDRITRLITKLVKSGYLQRNFINNKRQLRVVKTPEGGGENTIPPWYKYHPSVGVNNTHRLERDIDIEKIKIYKNFKKKGGYVKLEERD